MSIHKGLYKKLTNLTVLKNSFTDYAIYCAAVAVQLVAFCTKFPYTQNKKHHSATANLLSTSLKKLARTCLLVTFNLTRLLPTYNASSFYTNVIYL